jgi:Na+/proline symporter
MMLGLGSLPSQDIFQRMNASKSEKTAVNSFYWGAALYLIVAVLPLFIALAARQLYPEWLSGEIQQLLPRVVLAHSPFWVQVLFFGALLSAIFSTCSGALLAPASILTENIVKPLWSKKLSDKKLLLLLRLSVFVMATLSTLMALRRSNIYELVGESSVLGLVTLLVPMFSAVYLPSATTRGAYFSMLAGGIGWWYFTYLQPMAVPALIPGLLLSMAGMWLGNRLSGRLPAF